MCSAGSFHANYTPRNAAEEICKLAGLFVIVEALNGAGALEAAVHLVQEMKSWEQARGALPQVSSSRWFQT